MEQIAVKIVEPLAVKFIMGILITLYITGCSDTPYTGSILTHEVDRYLVSRDGNAICFQDDLDETCLELTRETGNGVNATHGPNVHIYPEDHVYLFYYEGKPIVRAERANRPTPNAQNGNGNGNNDNNNGDNTGDRNDGNNNGNNDNNNGDNTGDRNDGNNANNNDDNVDGTNGDNNGDNTRDRNDGNNGNNDNNNGDNTGDRNDGNNGNNNDDNVDGTNGDNNGDNNSDNTDDRNGDNNDNNNDDNTADGHGWIIWVYYPDGVIPQNPPTLSESGVTITINGNRLADEDITGFAQFVDPTGEKGIQFFYPTQSAALLDLKVQIKEAIGPEGTAKFNLNYLWKAR